MTKTDTDDIAPQELLEAINRSGYLLESEVSKALSKAGFFVEANQSLLDPITGKSRELDILAEYYEYDQNRAKYKVCSTINFVFEIKNNSFPLVVMTDLEFSPNTQLLETIKEGRSVPEELDEFKIEGFYEELVEHDNSPIFTQYCSFSKKKMNHELMASHPEALHSGFSKIVQHCDEMLESFQDWATNDYHRFFLWQPILLIKDSLFEMVINEDKKPILNKVNTTKLMLNYHRNGQRASALIHIVTKQGLADYLVKMLKMQSRIGSRLIEGAKNV